MAQETLHAYLDREVGDASLRDLLDRIASACWSISSLVRRSALHGNPDEVGSANRQGDLQNPHELLADDVFARGCAAHADVALLISEEVDEVITLKDPQPGDFVVAYDPLNGACNLDVGLPVGSIFAVYKVSKDCGETALPSGRQLVCAGYAIYGPSTMLVLTIGNRVQGFSLDPETDTFILTHPDVTVPQNAAEFVITLSPRRAPIQNLVMRWTASMVAEVHSILLCGAIFPCPVDDESPSHRGNLRLFFEAYPMAMILEAAGGKVTNGRTPILDLKA